jgi:outer membrane protein TolC
MADFQADLTSGIEIIPVTAPNTQEEGLSTPLSDESALALAMAYNATIQQARAGVEVADINVRVARNQRMPRLDLVTSARTQGLDRERAAASGQLLDGDYASYGVGVTFEFPLGNRGRHAELLKRRLERRKAISVLHNVADQVAVQVKERIRKVTTNLAEITLQIEAATAARAHLQALEDSEMVRERLTAEFLLVKLQAQEVLAQAERAANSATVEFNIALAELAQATGTVLDLHVIDSSLSNIAGAETNTGVGDPDTSG